MDMTTRPELIRRHQQPPLPRIPAERRAVFGRHDPAHCLAPGLFRALQKTGSKRKALDISYQHGKTLMRFVGYSQLGAEDLHLLQALVALASVKPDGFSVGRPETTRQQKVAKRLNPDEYFHHEKCAIITTSLRQVLATMGLTVNAQACERVKESLRRLANVTLYIIDGRDRELPVQLIARYFRDGDRGLVVGLNPRLSHAVLGIKGKHARIAVSEIRTPLSAAARLIHQRLCGYINPGTFKSVRLPTLLEYVFPDDEGRLVAPGTARKRVHTVRKAMTEIGALKGWGAEEDEPGLYIVTRPAVRAIASKRKTSTGLMACQPNDRPQRSDEEPLPREKTAWEIECEKKNEEYNRAYRALENVYPDIDDWDDNAVIRRYRDECAQAYGPGE